MEARVQRVEDADRFFPKQALHQCIDVGGQDFFLFQGRRQHHGAVPRVQCIFFRDGRRFGLAAMVGQLLQQQAARDAVVRGQPQTRIELFRAQHVVFDHGRHVVAVQRHDALVRLLARHLVGRVQGDDEAALARGVEQLRHGGDVGDGGVRVQLGRGAQAQVGVALDDHQAHGTVTVDLHDDGAVEFQVGRQQGGGSHHFAQHFFHGRRIGVARYHFLPGVGNVDELAAHGGVVENKFLQGILAANGCADCAGGFSRHSLIQSS